MHFLNTLPQRLDPGATPTFAGLIASSLTSPASTNLTLAGGAGNSSIILTPAGTGNVGIGTASPGSKLEVVGVARIGSSAGTNFPTYRGSVVLQDSEVVGPQATGGLEWVTNASSGSGYGWKQYTSSATGNLSIADRWNSATWTERVTFAGNTGNVSILSSTAGSASAGALVVTGGLSTGAASYIGGALTVNAAGTFAGAVDANVTSSNYITISSNATNKDAGFRSSDGTTLWIWGLLGDTSASTDGAYRLRQQGVGTLFSVAKNTGAATFAGAVTVTNVNSATGTVSAPNATATTLFAASTRGMYQVYAYIDAYDPNDWAATAVVTNTGNGSTLKITATNAASFTLTVSGLNVRVTQSGGSTFDVAWRYVRIQ